MNDLKTDQITEKMNNPIIQAGIVLGAAIVISIIAKLIKMVSEGIVPDLFPWMTAASFLLFFSVFNSVLSLSAKNMNTYWGRSIYCFMGLAALTGLMAYLFSSVSISNAGSFRWIFIVVTIGYLVFLSIMTFMRKIVEFAQKEEWNQPRIRR